MGNDFKSESHGYVARIEDHTNNVDDGSVRKRGKERGETEEEEERE